MYKSIIKLKLNICITHSPFSSSCGSIENILLKSLEGEGMTVAVGEESEIERN